MSKTLAYRILGIGRLPKRFRRVLEMEGVLQLDEGIRCSITHRHFKAPGRRHSWRRQWFSGSLVMTERRFAAFSNRNPLINVPFDDPRITELEAAVDDDGRLRIRFDAAAFNEGHSGSIEIHFTTPHAGLYLGRLPRKAEAI